MDGFLLKCKTLDAGRAGLPRAILTFVAL